MKFNLQNACSPKDPVFLEGLPGIGNVGKLTCDHIVKQLHATPWFEITSRDFPPQVTIQDDGTVRLVHAMLWHVPGALGDRDLVVLTGDFQPMSPDGQYGLVEGVLEKIPSCKELYTIGGFGLGATVDEPSVMGAATDTEMVASLKAHGVRFEEEEPGAGIIGASGLFLGVGMQRGLRGACLMGETSGFLPDPQSAAKVLAVLQAHIGLVVDAENLDEEAEELSRIASQLKDGETFGPVDDMHYG